MLQLAVTAALANLNPSGAAQPAQHIANLGHVAIIRKDTLLVAYRSLPGSAGAGRMALAISAMRREFLRQRRRR